MGDKICKRSHASYFVYLYFCRHVLSNNRLYPYRNIDTFLIGNSLDGVEEINLIEIDIPEKINDDLEKVIFHIARAIAKEYSWVIDENAR